METLIANLPYLGIVIILLLSGFGLPLPEDVPLIFGGYLCGQGKAQIELMLPLALASVIGADMLIYLMGRLFGHQVPKLPLFRKFLSEARLASAAESFHRHGGKTLFIARFLPGLRTPVFFTAGTFKISAWKMFFADGLAALISVPTLMLLAYYFSDHLEQVRKYVSQGQHVVGGVIVVGIAIIALTQYSKHQKKKKSEEEKTLPKEPTLSIEQNSASNDMNDPIQTDTKKAI